MRDSLTALAGAVILILVAALAVPPFVDWAAHRSFVDRVIARSLGLPARSEGRIELRLLPSPRVRFDRLQVGEGADAPVLDTRFVKAEVALAPLLKGEVRFTETRIGRAEIRLPVTEGDGFVLPAGVVEAAGERDLVIEDLHVQQFLVTTQVARTGRTDQVVADNVHLTAGSLIGPWQIEGASGGTRFRFASSALARDGSVSVKVSGGGDTRPRFEADARIVLVPLKGPTDKVPPDPGAKPGAEAARARPRTVVPEAEGSARLVVGPPTQAAGAYLPFSLGGRFKARGPIVRFEGVNAEIDPGGKAIRLAGSGQVDLRAWRAGLDLEARRIDLDGFLLSPAGQAMIARGPPGAGGLPILLDLGLKLDSLALGFDDWSDVAVKATFDRTGGLVLRGFRALAPGAARIAASGEVDFGPAAGFTGHLDLDAANSEGLGRTLRRVGLDGGLARLLDGRALKATADLSATRLDLSLRNLRLGLGEASVTGNARYSAAGPGGRGRLDAQIGARGIDIAELPPVDGLTQGLHGVDLGLTLQARDMRYGPAGAHSGNGTIAARIQSDGVGLAVDGLEVTDLAGANASLSGRIGADGSGRIAGRVSAPVAAPLLALLDRLWIPEARLVPAFLREGALSLDLTLERDAGAADTLRATARGRAGGGTVDLTALTRGGRLDRLDAGLATQQAGAWFGRGDLAALRRPANLTLAALRGAAADGPLGLTVSGTLAGLALATRKPIALAADQGPPEGGTLRIDTDDLAPLLALAGAVTSPTAPLPAALTLDLSRAGREARAGVSGTLAGAPVSGQLARAADGAVSGSGALQRLSLPALVGALALPTEARGGDPSAARFAPAPGHPRAEIDLTVARLDLGRGLVAEGAGFRLGLDGDGLSLRGLSGRLAGGTLKGSVSIGRQGGSATVSGEGSLAEAAIPALAGDGPLSGRLSATLRFGATGETLDGLAGALSGSGEIRLAGLGLPGADPGGIGRTLVRALAEDDPLREGRLQGLLAEEFAAGPLAQTGAATASATLGAGALRAGPLTLDLGSARWTGTLGLDARARRLDARGTLTAIAPPKGWTAGLPAVQFGLSGPWAAPERTVDGGPLTNGLAALVLQRELEKIELFDADQSERQRRRARIEMDRARVAERAAAERAMAERAAAEKAAADRAAAEAARRAAETAPAPEPVPQP